MSPEEIASKLEALSPPDRLRFAANMLEARQARIAYSVASGVVTELGAALVMADAPPEPLPPKVPHCRRCGDSGARCVVCRAKGPSK